MQKTIGSWPKKSKVNVNDKLEDKLSSVFIKSNKQELKIWSRMTNLQRIA